MYECKLCRRHGSQAACPLRGTERDAAATTGLVPGVYWLYVTRCQARCSRLERPTPSQRAGRLLCGSSRCVPRRGVGVDTSTGPSVGDALMMGAGEGSARAARLRPPWGA